MKWWQTEKGIMRIILTMVVLMLFCWGIIVWNENRIIILEEKDIVLPMEGEKYRYYLNEINYEEDGISSTQNRITMKGWITLVDQKTESIFIKIVLRNTDSGNYYIIPTTVFSYTGVTEYINDGFDHSLSGFRVSIPQGEKIDLEHYDYDVYALCCVNDVERLVPLETTVKTWSR